MNYQISEKNDEIFFKYKPKKNIGNTFTKSVKKENPFSILKDLNLN